METNKIENQSNRTVQTPFSQTYFHGTKANLQMGDSCERIYLVEQTGTVEDDPNLTDKKFPGNPAKSYLSKYPSKVVGEVTIWQEHASEQLKPMKEGIEIARENGIEAIED